MNFKLFLKILFLNIQLLQQSLNKTRDKMLEQLLGKVPLR